MKPQTISLCMIVKNEEKTLARCLESIKDVVDEIVIVDTGSTDSTVSIAENYNAKVFHYTWNHDFSAARNCAIQYATCDYILSLDADEWVNSDSKVLLTGELEADYYYLRIRNIIRSGLVETHSYIRLFKRSVGFVYENVIHEQINVDKFPNTDGKYLAVTINHDGYTKSNMTEKNKNERNMGLIERELLKNPSSFGYFNLGTQYKLIGNYSKAIEAYKKSYSLGSNRMFTHKLIVYLVQCLSEQERFQDAINILNDAIGINPDYTDYHFYLGTIYFNMKYWKDAELCFLKCLEIGEVNQYQFTSFEGVGSFMANAYLAQIYDELGEEEKSRQCLADGILNNRMYIPSLKLWLDKFPNASSDDLFTALSNLYEMSNSDQILLLIKSLYQLRHPLFNKFLKLYQVDLDKEVAAWVQQLNQEWEDAKRTWRSIGEISPTSYRDIVFLSVVTGDVGFYDEFKIIANNRQKDDNFIKHLIANRKVEQPLSEELQEIFSTLCYDLINLKQYEVLERVIYNLPQPSIRYLIALQLKKFHFFDLALETLIVSPDKDENYKVLILAGDLLQSLKQFGDSYQYYSEAYQVKPSFDLAYKMYHLALEVGDKETEIIMFEQLKEFVPHSRWVTTSASIKFAL